MLAIFVLVAVTGLGVGEAVNGRESCPRPYHLVGGKCLMVSELSQVNWTDARNFCHQLQGELVKIDIPDFFMAVVDHIKDNGMDRNSFWIGASDEGHEGDWRWVVDNSKVDMGVPYWANSCGYHCLDPNDQDGTENYASLEAKSSLFFNDSPGSHYKYPICQM